eukprot:CAMPEP_0174851636 /NCGR_PEP_ID=MMETSP1114-20130205/23296_1 /TAXON_ID=312471 /ORGANISM="Neobodo designis, Strain CCAP 1951/1" /LENGTH=279 /DNA_ID=CAMNT_0016086183 /DNA_START=66 /DNA_END=904 /DNA_ORIENTATION=+
MLDTLHPTPSDPAAAVVEAARVGADAAAVDDDAKDVDEVFEDAADPWKPMAAAVFAARTVHELRLHHSDVDTDPDPPGAKAALQHPEHADVAMRSIAFIAAMGGGPDLLVNGGVVDGIAACIATNPARRAVKAPPDSARTPVLAAEAHKWVIVRAGILPHLNTCLTSTYVADFYCAAGFLYALLPATANCSATCSGDIVPALLRAIDDPDTRAKRLKCFEAMAGTAVRDAECARLILHQAGFDADAGLVSTPEARRVCEAFKSVAQPAAAECRDLLKFT